MASCCVALCVMQVAGVEKLQALLQGVAHRVVVVAKKFRVKSRSRYLTKIERG